MLPAPVWYPWLAFTPVFCLAVQFSCSAVSDVEACLPTWFVAVSILLSTLLAGNMPPRGLVYLFCLCLPSENHYVLKSSRRCDCASQIATLPLPVTAIPSLAGGGITLLTTAVSSSTFQYSLGCDGSCDFATIPSQAICVYNKNIVPTCPTPANILINGACVVASGQGAQATDCSNAPFGGSNGTTVASSSFLFKAASTAGVLASSTSNVSPTITSAAVQSTPYVDPNPYGCSQVM